jgi:hypothetical protein
MAERTRRCCAAPSHGLKKEQAQGRLGSGGGEDGAKTRTSGGF